MQVNAEECSAYVCVCVCYDRTKIEINGEDGKASPASALVTHRECVLIVCVCVIMNSNQHTVCIRKET